MSKGPSVAEPIERTACAPRQPAPGVLPTHKFALLDGLRGLAACLIVWLHFPKLFGTHYLPKDTFLIVDFFFCLSGFVLAFAYEQRLMRGMRFGSFVKARLFRLYPVFALGLAIGVAAFRVDPIFRHREFAPIIMMLASAALNIVMLPSPHSLLFVFDGPLWTIFFDLLASFAYVALVRTRRASNGLLLAIAAVSFAVLAWQRSAYGSIDLGPYWQGKSEGFTRAGVSFFAGVLCLRLFVARKPKPVEGAAAVGLAILLGVAFVVALARPVPHAWTAAYQLTIVAAGFPVLCYAGARLHLRGRAANLCAVLSTIAYSLYALHVPVMKLLAQVPLHARLLHTQAVVVDVAVLALATWLTGWIYEPRVRGWLAATFSGPRSQTATPVPIPRVR